MSPVAFGWMVPRGAAPFAHPRFPRLTATARALASAAEKSGTCAEESGVRAAGRLERGETKEGAREGEWGWGEVMDGGRGAPQEKLRELAVLVRWRRPDMVSMWLLEGLSAAVQLTACGKRWW